MIGLVILAAATVSVPGNDADSCRNPGPGALAEQMCASNEQIDADNDLNKIWPDALKAADEIQRDHVPDAKFNARAELLRTQRAWLTYRNAACQFIYNSEDSGSTMHASADQEACLARLTRARIHELREELGV